jgi:hypothetical protein
MKLMNGLSNILMILQPSDNTDRSRLYLLLPIAEIGCVPDTSMSLHCCAQSLSAIWVQNAIFL